MLLINLNVPLGKMSDLFICAFGITNATNIGMHNAFAICCSDCTKGFILGHILVQAVSSNCNFFKVVADSYSIYLVFRACYF